MGDFSSKLNVKLYSGVIFPQCWMLNYVLFPCQNQNLDVDLDRI